MNKLVIAAAGSGKTRLLVNTALEIKDQRVLITTFTVANALTIREMIIDKNGFIPSNIHVQTWFSFLIQHWVKPYQNILFGCNLHIKGMRLVSGGAELRRPAEEKNPTEHYFNKNNRIYSDRIAKFGFKTNKNSKNRVIDRLARIYGNIFIDEIQDMVGYDLDIIEKIAESKINLILVGDPRQVTYRTHPTAKNPKYQHGRFVDFFKDKYPKTFSTFDVDDKSLKKTYRHGKEICDFANRIWENMGYPEYTYDEKRVPGKDEGVFLVQKRDVEDYLAKYPDIVQLRHSKSDEDPDEHYQIMNYGLSKGATFDRVVIYPTNPIKKWLINPSEELKFLERCKFYVAVTRARYSVAIVVSNRHNTPCKGARLYCPPGKERYEQVSLFDL